MNIRRQAAPRCLVVLPPAAVPVLPLPTATPPRTAALPFSLPLIKQQHVYTCTRVVTVHWKCSVFCLSESLYKYVSCVCARVCVCAYLSSPFFLFLVFVFPLIFYLLATLQPLRLFLLFFLSASGNLRKKRDMTVSQTQALL